MLSAKHGGDMTQGLYFTVKPELGECAYVDDAPAGGGQWLTRLTYEADGYEPPFDELPRYDGEDIADA
jgi:hypothetical protein